MQLSMQLSGRGRFARVSFHSTEFCVHVATTCSRSVSITPASDEESICSEAVPLLQGSRNSRKGKDSDKEMRGNYPRMADLVPCQLHV